MSNAVFQRPDWRDATKYEHLAKSPPGRQLAWEFLRRNPDYQADWLAYMTECEAWEQMHLCQENTGLGLPTKRFLWWCWHFQLKWDLKMPVSPARDYLARVLSDEAAKELGVSPFADEVPFVVDEFDNIDAYTRADGHIESVSAKILVPINLELPVTMILAKVKRVVDGLREEGIRSGAISPITSRVLNQRLYVQELRALDADAAGLGPAEFSEGLLDADAKRGDVENRNKTARDRLKSAKKTMSSGYKLFLAI